MNTWHPVTERLEPDRSEPLPFELTDADRDLAESARHHIHQHVQRLNARDVQTTRKRNDERK